MNELFPANGSEFFSLESRNVAQHSRHPLPSPTAEIRRLAPDVMWKNRNFQFTTDASETYIRCSVSPITRKGSITSTGRNVIPPSCMRSGYPVGCRAGTIPDVGRQHTPIKSLFSNAFNEPTHSLHHNPKPRNSTKLANAFFPKQSLKQLQPIITVPRETICLFHHTINNYPNSNGL